VLVGRQRETGVLDDLLDRTPPQAAVLLVLGDPGIGKSSLLRAAERTAHASGFRVLSVVGVEPEATLPFAGLHQMLRPVLDSVSLLPRVEREALLPALGLAEGPPPEPYLIALAVVNLLASVSADQPIAVLADDMQWLDPQTHEVLAFIGHQMAGPVVVLATMRTGHFGPFLSAGFSQLRVGGVDQEAAARILSANAPRLSPAERRRIQGEALGNPLALLELPAALRLSPSPMDGLRPLNLSDRLLRAFAGPASELPTPTHDALLVAAVDSSDDLAEIIAATSVLCGSDVSRAVLTPAEMVGLVTVREGSVGFRHPLMRSAVLQSERLARRKAAHAALADVLADEPYRRTQHRAQSVVGLDDRIADELEANAAVALGRGTVMSAIADLERSAQLTAGSTPRGHRLLKAAEHAFGLGRADILDHLLQGAARTYLSELDQARMEWLREIFNDGVPGDARRVLDLCDIAVRSAAADDHDLALNLLLGAALRCWWADTGPEARARVAAVTERMAPAVADDPRYTATLALAEPVLRCGVVTGALSRARTDGLADANALRLLGMAARAVGDETLSVGLLGSAEARLRAQGSLGLLSHVLGVQAMVHLDLGDLDRAAACVQEGGRLSDETRQPTWRTSTLACDSILHALQGNAERSLRLAAEAELEAGRRRLNDLLSCVQLARGVAWLSAGRHEDAYVALRRAFDPADPSFHQRERFTSLMYLAEAADRAGQRDDARQVLAEMEGLARTTPTPILHAHLPYARAVLATDKDAESLYLEALRRDLSDWPLARARTELAYGVWLRRQCRLDQARVLLNAAQTTFDRIGSAPWGDEARLEMGATGASPTWPPPAGRGRIHRRERQISALATGGLPDTEIAYQLYLPVGVVTLYRQKLRGTSGATPQGPSDFPV
jgi:tetratricopeptide (TPR) repeat protein